MNKRGRSEPNTASSMIGSVVNGVGESGGNVVEGGNYRNVVNDVDEIAESTGGNVVEGGNYRNVVNDVDDLNGLTEDLNVVEGGNYRNVVNDVEIDESGVNRTNKAVRGRRSSLNSLGNVESNDETDVVEGLNKSGNKRGMKRRSETRGRKRKQSDEVIEGNNEIDIGTPVIKNKGGRPSNTRRKGSTPLTLRKQKEKKAECERISREKAKNNERDDEKYRKLCKKPKWARKIIENFLLHCVKLYDVGDLTDKCNHCKAKYFPGENVRKKKGEYDQCCNMGNKIIDDIFEDFPNKLRSLFERNAHGVIPDDNDVLLGETYD